MAQRRRRRRKPVEKEVVEEVVEEVVVEEEEEDEPPVKPKRRRRSRKKPAPKPEPEEEEEDEEPVEEVVAEEPEEEEEPEPEPKPKKKVAIRRSRKRKSRRKKDEEAEEETPEEAPKEPESAPLPKALSKRLEGQFLFDMLEAMDKGQSVTIVRKAEDEWVLGVGGDIVIESVMKLSGKAYEEEVLSEEYLTHYLEWKNLSDDEKYEIIEDEGAEWDEHDNDKINMMRATISYRAKLGITKYKPQYQDAASRRAIKA
jgi:hypothetical protein